MSRKSFWAGGSIKSICTRLLLFYLFLPCSQGGKICGRGMVFHPFCLFSLLYQDSRLRGHPRPTSQGWTSHPRNGDSPVLMLSKLLCKSLWVKLFSQQGLFLKGTWTDIRYSDISWVHLDFQKEFFTAEIDLVLGVEHPLNNVTNFPSLPLALPLSPPLPSSSSSLYLGRAFPPGHHIRETG